MKRKFFKSLKKTFLLLFWFFKRVTCTLPLIGKKLMRKRKKVYETYIEHLLKFRNDSPLNLISTPPWSLKVSGACLVLGKYLSSNIYHIARSHRYVEIYGFILGKRIGDLFIGITFREVTNILHSINSALPDLEHVSQLKREIASHYPELEIVCTVHSHPGGLLLPSMADKICFLADGHPNIIVSPNRLLGGLPVRRLAAFYHSAGKVRRIKLSEIDKNEPELEDIDFKDLEPSKEELLDVGELATEIDFKIYKIWLISNPNLTLKKLGKKLSELFGEKIGFVFLYKEDKWVYDPDMKIVDFFLKDGDHLVFPEFFEEVKNE
jgi:proteasome lid subunit RPN8/RPN11